MMSRVFCACPVGVCAVVVCVEVDVRANHLKVSIVGLPDMATRESKDRLIPAITNSGFALTSDEIVINLSPADLRKEGTAYDLPMAVGILAAKGIVPGEPLESVMLLGELALDGSLRPVRSVLASAECAKAMGFKALAVPPGNGGEASLVEGLVVYEVDNLARLVRFLKGREVLTAFVRKFSSRGPSQAGEALDLADVRGHALVKRALEIAAAGQHNLLLFGPPGSGKSMLGKRLPGILAPMNNAEMLQVTRIYSCAGKLAGKGECVWKRPFRSPHHTASPAALIGGGSIPKPGEVTLSHRGVLFLDEFPEFPRAVLEVLRQPLEDRQVTISRVHQQITFPSDFLLVAAMNPCPCGWRGDLRRRCLCSPRKVREYCSRISGPLLDRIDLQVEVPAMPLAAIRRLPPSESSATVAVRVAHARSVQERRFGSKLTLNGSMSSKQLRACCRLPEPLARVLESKLDLLGCSSRVHDKILRVARTIADLQRVADIQRDHLMEALGYRQMDYRLPGPEPSILRGRES